MSAVDVRAYYNDDLKDRIERSRLSKNPRLEAATKFFLEAVESDSIVLDVGCGLGTATEAMAKKAKKGIVHGIDISDQYIWYAKKTVTRQNAKFHVVDITDHQAVKSSVQRPVQLFTLGDVLEHTPEDQRIKLFDTFRQMSSDNAKILATIPSEFYQRYLQAENKKALQPIDNALSPELLDHEARAAGWCLTGYKLINMWQYHQYAHVTFQKLAYAQHKARMKLHGTTGRNFLDQLRLKSRHRKYVADVFGN